MSFRRGALVITVALLVTACGAPPSATPPGADPIALLAQNMQDAGGARMSMEMSLSNMGQDIKATMEGEADFATGNARLTMHFLDPSSSGFLEYRMLMVDRVMYFQPPGMESTSGKWMRIELDGITGVPTIGMDPQMYLDFLDDTSDEFETIGEEEVRGVPTTHYKVEVDVAKLLATFAGSSDLGTDPDEIKSELGETLPVEVWIDGEGLLRREIVKLTTGPSGPMELSLEIYDYGIDVQIEAPGPDEIVEEQT